MDLDKTVKKALFLTDMEPGLEPFLQQETTIELKNMLIMQSYGTVISNPYGDLMRSIILAIYQENIEEIFVVGTEGKRNVPKDLKSLLDSERKEGMEELRTLNYMFENSFEFRDKSIKEWIEKEDENVSERIQKSIELIRKHPLIPVHVKIKGLIVKRNEKESETFVRFNTYDTETKAGLDKKSI